ncbi:hypothetical protein EJ04DRAFT_430743, partial [Polyplosphaeria fusca]
DGPLERSRSSFSRNHGVWGPEAATLVGEFAKHGNRVKMGSVMVKDMCLPKDACNIYVRATSDGIPAGNLFATKYNYNGRDFVWISQLVVGIEFRRRGLATQLLQHLRQGENLRGFGILSSHPAAICATLRAFGRGLEDVSLDMAQTHAAPIMNACPIKYVAEATLVESLFQENVTDGTICSAFTKFYVDHTESLHTLQDLEENNRPWPFGKLLEGHEFLAIVKVKTAAEKRAGQESAEF